MEQLSFGDIDIRLIQPADNAAMARVIRSTLEEFGANHPGTVYYDDTTDHLFELFQATPGSLYYVALLDGNVVGGAGIFPTEGLPEKTCELVKMYLLPSVRGIGLGRYMIESCINAAKALHYQQIYLESMPELRQALKVYERFGFRYLPAPMGNSGHTGCQLWMLKVL